MEIETGLYAKKDIRVFLSIASILLVVLVALYLFELKYHFVDNIAQKLYNIVVR